MKYYTRRRYLEQDLAGELAWVQALADWIYRWFDRRRSDTEQDAIGDALIEAMKSNNQNYFLLEDGLINDAEEIMPRGQVVVNGQTVLIPQNWAGGCATIMSCILLLCRSRSVTTEQMQDLWEEAVTDARDQRRVIRDPPVR